MRSNVYHYFTYIYDLGAGELDLFMLRVGNCLERIIKSYPNKDYILMMQIALFNHKPNLKSRFEIGYTVLDEDDWEDAFNEGEKMEESVVFKNLPREEKLLLFTATLDGKEIQYWSDVHKDWVTKPKDSVLYLNTAYRLKPPSKPSINWDEVNPKYNWLCTSSHGKPWLFEKKPRPNQTGWANGGFLRQADVFSSFKQGECDWKDSLLGRPS